jgi:hypothetical protein
VRSTYRLLLKKEVRANGFGNSLDDQAVQGGFAIL